ncbi:hypothetical protein DVH24_008041 [Malus domestica]|uniref:CCHC-type domain-containing protein n=1 Tax=Malus domestica TaxID=3750 RepID=A0A498JQK9_MALDO|nr:hypothetical protein DVH24_008041 [Malus domestica]
MGLWQPRREQYDQQTGVSEMIELRGFQTILILCVLFATVGEETECKALMRDEEMASRILEQVPWAVMKQNFPVKQWPNDLALEEVQVEMVQMNGIPLYLCMEESARRLAGGIGELLEIEDLAYARGFLRVRVMFKFCNNNKNPLVPEVWLPRTRNRDTWIELRYERFQDFCYRCDIIGHVNTDCSLRPNWGRSAG